MKRKIGRTIEISYLPLVIIFLIVVLLQGIGIISIPTQYAPLAYILLVPAIPGLLQPIPADGARLPFASSYVLLAALVFALGIRLFPLIHSPIPLGYDPGFYKYPMELYVSTLPQIPVIGLPNWIREMHEQGIFVLSTLMHIMAGIDAFKFMNFLFPLVGAFLVLPVFLITRDLFGQRAGVIAAVLYAVSYTQFNTFAMYYYRNVLGLMFLLLSFYALEKEKYGLMALMFAAMGIFHRPEFLLFALVLVPFFMLHRRQGIILAVLGTALLIAPFWLAQWQANLDLMSGTIEAVKTRVETGEGLGSGGTFFGLDTYTMVSLAYLPFALMGAIHLVVKRNWNSILLYFLISLILVVFELIFFRRMIIPLDIAIVILAGAGIDRSLLDRREMGKAVALTAVILLLVTSAVPTVISARDARPRINEQQLAAVEWIKENTESNAYVLATSSDAPWVLGWSERKVIAPGLFEWYVQSQEEWFTFLESRDPEVAKHFMEVYDSPVYIYSSNNQGNEMTLEKFEGAYFRKVYDEGALIYRYIGGNQ